MLWWLIDVKNDGNISTQAEDTGLKLESIKAAVLESTQELCQCGFISDRLTNEVFQCFPASPEAVTYRATLHGTTSANSTQLISHIEQWTAEEAAAITIQQVLLRVDGSCTVAVSSLVDDECQKRNTRSDSEPASSNVIIISGVALATVIIVVIVVIIVSTVAICIKKSKQKENQERYFIPY